MRGGANSMETVLLGLLIVALFMGTVGLLHVLRKL